MTHPAMVNPAADPAKFIHPFEDFDAAALIRARTLQYGDRTFLVWEPFEKEHARSWTWKQFEDDVARVAGGLLARGIRAGDRVLVHFDNCPETFIARFACCWIGAVAVLSNSVLAGPEIRHAAEISGARAAITQPKLAARIAEHCPGLEWIAVTDTDAGETPAPGDVPAASDRFANLFAERAPARAPDPRAPAMILFTTGTTSRPKAVLWTHANVLWGGRLGAMHQALTPQDIYQVFLPVYHVVGFSWSWLSALWAGATIVLQPRFSASRFWPVVVQHKVTVTAQVHFTAKVLMGQPAPQHNLRQHITANHDAAVAAYFGVREVGAWGMTEMVAQGIVGDPWTDQPSRTIGRPSPGYRILIEDENRRLVQPGETGHLKVLGVPGVSIFAEYFGNAQATADAFDDRGYFDPGDRVILHEDGWIEFGDRTKDVIKVGGESVSGAEVEFAIAEVDGVREVAVVAREDNDYGEIPVAFIAVKDDVKGNEEKLRAAVLDHCKSALAKFKQPREIVFIEALPRIGFGKVEKVKLRQMAVAKTPETAS